MPAWLLVFIGGGIGSVIRYAISTYFFDDLNLKQGHLPYPTLIANVISCFVAGVVMCLITKQVVDQNLKYLVMVGFCGGLSTFSTFSVETVVLFQHGYAGTALVYSMVSIGMCVGAVVLGMYAGNQLQ